MLRGIPCAWMRGGTSKGAYFLAEDLPEDPKARDRLLLAVMGSPDPRQIDGIGGSTSLTSKVAVISKSDRPDADIDYLFLQVVVDQAHVDDGQNCGNILAAVGPFAIERGLAPVQGETTRIRIHMVNSGSLVEAEIETPNGHVNYEGDTAIDGVPGTAAPVMLDFLDVAGSACGSLMPTGNPLDTVEGVEATLMDNGMPVVILRAVDFGRTGYESKDALDKDEELKSRIEPVRLTAGKLMGLGDVAGRTIPKVCLIAPPREGGILSTRSFIPHAVHASVGVFAAVTVATAALTFGSVCDGIAELPADDRKICPIEHPTGQFVATVTTEPGPDGQPAVARAGIVRTARLLFDGTVFVPEAAAA